MRRKDGDVTPWTQVTLFEPNLQIQYKSTFIWGPFVCISLLITNLSKILTGIMLPFCVVQMCSSIFQDYLN